MMSTRIIQRGEKMSFGAAFDSIKKNTNYFMRLPKWSHDVRIKVQVPDDNSKMTAPYLYVESRFGRVPWKETNIELFSEEWEVYEVLTKSDNNPYKTKARPVGGTIMNDKKETKKEEHHCSGCGKCKKRYKGYTAGVISIDEFPSPLEILDAILDM